MMRFPNTTYKDQVDALAHAAMHVQRVRGAPAGEGDAEHRTESDKTREQDEELPNHPGTLIPADEPQPAPAIADPLVSEWMND